MKRTTTIFEASTSQTRLRRRWEEDWKALPQDLIRSWIAAIPHHIKQIIRLEGGNEYKEGREAYKREYAGKRRVGILSTHAYIPREQ